MNYIRRAIWFLSLAALVLVGCATNPRSHTLKQGEAAISQRFDFSSVDEFLRHVVATHPAVDGVSLTSARIGSPWRMAEQDYPHRIRSGRWLLDDRAPNEEFTVSYELSGQRVIIVTAKRFSRTSFEEISVQLAFIGTTKC